MCASSCLHENRLEKPDLSVTYFWKKRRSAAAGSSIARAMLLPIAYRCVCLGDKREGIRRAGDGVPKDRRRGRQSFDTDYQGRLRNPSNRALL